MNKSTFKNGWHKALLTAVLVSLFWPSGQVSAAINAVIEPDEPVLAVDINEDGKSSAPDHLLAVGETLFFAADSTETGVELWLSLPL